MPKQPKPSVEQTTKSAVLLAKVILTNRQPGMLDKHVQRLLGELIWKVTEADGKRNTRYWSKAALACKDKQLLRHEHVTTKKDIIGRLLKAELKEVEAIFKEAIACTVTEGEHKDLTKHDKTARGWHRYELAEIDVIDRRTGEPLSFIAK